MSNNRKEVNIFNKNFLSIDLELEQPNSNSQCPDSKINVPRIIQVGWAVFSPDTNDDVIIKASGSYYVHYDLELSSFIKKLTKITDEDLSKSLDDSWMVLKEITDIMDYYECDRRIVEWGSGDLSALIEESRKIEKVHTENELIPFFAGTKINVALLYRLFNDSIGAKTGGLRFFCNKEKLPPFPLRRDGKNRTYHDAEVDAIQTARLFGRYLNKMRNLLLS